MKEIIIPFLLTFIAGMSTMLGTIFIFIKCSINKLTSYSLSFAAGVMISVSLIDLIPESLKFLIKNNIKNKAFTILLIGIIIGIIISLFIDKIIPETKKVKNKNLYRIGIFSMIAIIMHNIPEGIITYLTSSKDISLGIMLTLAIAIHNLPEGISIAVPLYSATKSKKRAIGDTLISALAEPLGALLAFLFLKPVITNKALGIILAITSGIMLHIGVFKLLPTSLKYKEKTKSIIIFFIGFIFMILSNKIMSFF